MEVFHRAKVNRAFDSLGETPRYLTAILDTSKGGVVVQSRFKGTFTVSEIVLFTTTFEGKPAMGGMFVGSEGDHVELSEVTVKEFTGGAGRPPGF